jgi:hypothetical protein
MKKILFLLAIVSVLFLASCADSKTIDGVTYRPYGLLNEETCKNDSIVYEVSAPAVITSIIFCELIIPPVYSVGFNLYEPIAKKSAIYKNKGVVQ